VTFTQDKKLEVDLDTIEIKVEGSGGGEGGGWGAAAVRQLGRHFERLAPSRRRAAAAPAERVAPRRPAAKALVRPRAAGKRGQHPRRAQAWLASAGTSTTPVNPIKDPWLAPLLQGGRLRGNPLQERRKPRTFSPLASALLPCPNRPAHPPYAAPVA
jgi:hypothetical protein